MKQEVDISGIGTMPVALWLQIKWFCDYGYDWKYTQSKYMLKKWWNNSVLKIDGFKINEFQEIIYN